MEERKAAYAAAGGIGDVTTFGVGKKPKQKRYSDQINNIDQLLNHIGDQKTVMAEFGEIMKTLATTIVPANSASTPAAAPTAPIVTPCTFTELTKKIAMLQEEKLRAKALDDCTINISAKIKKLQDDRDKLL